MNVNPKNRRLIWETLADCPMTQAQLVVTTGLSEAVVRSAVASMINLKVLAQLPSKALRVTGTNPLATKVKETTPTMRLRNSKTTPLKVPNSVWQWGAFV